jgi:glycosyltransferase involved in cell wall biosynthesis
MRILFISRHYPNDLHTSTYGTYQRMGMLIDAIKEIAQLDVLFYVPLDIDISSDAIAVKEQELSQHWNTPIHLSLCHLFSYPNSLPKWRRHLQGVFNFSKQLLFFGTSGTEQVEAFEQCLQRNPDIIFVHRLGPMAPVLLTARPLPPIILDLDDIEHINSMRSLKQLPQQLEAWMYGLQIPALCWGELRAVRRANSTFICSDSDHLYLTEQWRLPGVKVVPNTVNIPEPQSTVVEPTLLFLASYQYEPNLHAANFLLEKIWPYIYLPMPEAKLIIAGREPQKIRSYNKKNPGVEFTGFVENLCALYQKSRVVCCPILSGGGTRIKMVEAAAYGKPIVATTIGAEGLIMSDGQEFLLRNNPREFALACLDLLRDSSLCKELGESAHKAASYYYDRTKVQKLIQMYIQQVDSIN